MARKDLQPLHGPWDREAQARQTDYAATHDVSSHSLLSGEHEDLLAYYFGEPTSTHKDPGFHLRHIRSPW